MSAQLHERFTGRTARVIDYLVKRGSAGATQRELVIRVEPGCKPNNMAGTLATLVRAGKVVAQDGDGCKRYVATATARVDRRTSANAKKRGVPRPRRAHQIALAGLKGGEPRPRMQLATMVARPAAAPATHTGAAETVEQYLARGGHVQQLPNGATSTHPNGFAPLPPRQARALGGDLPNFIPD